MTLAELTAAENASIRRFVEQAGEDDHFAGDVLDFGCGRSPYRDIIESHGGTYHGYDEEGYEGSGGNTGNLIIPSAGGFSAILCTQVVQFVPNVPSLLFQFRSTLAGNGALVLSWPTAWPEINETDLHRFTHQGMVRLLKAAGFRDITVTRRASFDLGDDVELAYGYGAVCHP